MDNTKEEIIKISGMMCDGCENTVAEAAMKVDGVIAVRVSHKDGTAIVKYNSEKTDLLFINMAINSTHYSVVEE